MNFPIRKSTRLENYDYSQSSAYFITVCSDKHRCMFSRISVGALREAPLPYKPRSELSKVIGFLKMNATKRIHETSPHEVVWQRGYYDHIIRDESDYAVRAKYICDNPFKWRDDEYFSVGDTNEIYHHG